MELPTTNDGQSLHLVYRDKYRLWVDLVRGGTDRLFVPTSLQLSLGRSVEVSVELANESILLSVRGTVVGWRPQSARYKEGLFLRLHEEELTRCRIALHLEQIADLQEYARRNYRFRRTIPARVIEPAAGGFSSVQNISESGVLLAGARSLRPGQRVAIEIHPNATPIITDAEVVWVNPEREIAGLQFVDLLSQTNTRLSSYLQKLGKQELQAGWERPSLFLVVDSDAAATTLVITALNRPGYEVLACNRGDETLDILRRCRPRLILLDALLPDVDAVELCRAIHSDDAVGHTPVVMMSALEPATLRELADACGASGYLAKPFRISDLMRTLESYLEG